MKKSLLLSVCLALSTAYATSQLIAFPGAEGFGKYAKGARASSAPTVYHVTNLNDTGTGSFRDAMSASNRIVVFDVAGVIKITSRIVVKSNIYIAGQTAPGEGITIYGNGFSFTGASNTICRYLRIRMGAVGDTGKDACGFETGDNMIFDHVSVAWGRDETFSINGTASNITIQNSIISQGLLSHSAGGLIQTDGGVSLYRNFYVDNHTRNNKIKGVNQYVNNIVYNWASGAYLMGGESEGQSYANCISNYFINGPEKSVNALSGANANFHIYADDNWWDSNRDGALNGYLVPQSEYSGGPDFQTAPYNYPVVPTWSASVLVDSLLPGVGASLPYRDLLDCYVVGQVRSFGKKGVIITNETENPIGIPTAWTMWAGTKRTDTDNDGIPDAWETANGLNPGLASDALATAANGYLNIENYINSIGKNYSQDYLRAPLCMVADSATQHTVYLSWFDFTEKEQGYCVERKINGTFTEIARTGVNGNTYLLTGLNPEQKDTLRVRAFNAGGYSAYSNVLGVKTKPVPVEVLDIASYVPDLTWTGAGGSSWDKTATNWTTASGATVFTDSAKVLFANSATKTITLNENAPVKAVVVNADSSLIINGTGFISGTGSLNKAGSGSLTLSTANTYTGATVLYDGTLNVSTLANGGAASSIGASKNYDFNLVLKGGRFNYTGASVSTDRNFNLAGNADIAVASSTSTLTCNGLLDGEGSLTKSGAGTLLLKGLNTYQGTTTINQGILDQGGSTAIINNAFTPDKSYLLNGGGLRTSGGSTTVYENYYSDITIPQGATASFEPYRNCYIYCKFIGSGTLNFNIPYVREYIKGDMSQFTGTFNANGLGTSSDGNQLMLSNKDGIPNARVVTSGTTKIVCWENASTMSLGGLSGPSGTFLSGADKNNNSSTMTWIVGGAGTDETFNGIINNECSNKSYKGATSIVKDGDGYWRLTAANIYAGTTTVKGGTLIVNGTQTGTGVVTINTDATLAGTGTIPGATEVQDGATISAGDPYAASSVTTGTLTVGALTFRSGSKALMEINKNTSAVDKITSKGAITLGGTLNLKITGTPVAGDQYILFTATSFTGAFDSILPAVPGEGLQWSFSNGVLRVQASTGVYTPADTRVKMYPNPATDRTALALDKSYRRVQISIESASGTCVSQQEFSSVSSISLNISALPQGLYFVRVKADADIDTSYKLMKK